jgi:hypothetical protein
MTNKGPCEDTGDCAPKPPCNRSASCKLQLAASRGRYIRRSLPRSGGNERNPENARNWQFMKSHGLATLPARPVSSDARYGKSCWIQRIGVDNTRVLNASPKMRGHCCSNVHILMRKVSTAKSSCNRRKAWADLNVYTSPVSVVFFFVGFSW